MGGGVEAHLTINLPPGCGSRAPRRRILAATTAIFIFMIALITAQVASLGSTRVFPTEKPRVRALTKAANSTYTRLALH